MNVDQLVNSYYRRTESECWFDCKILIFKTNRHIMMDANWSCPLHIILCQRSQNLLKHVFIRFCIYSHFRNIVASDRVSSLFLLIGQYDQYEMFWYHICEYLPARTAAGFTNISIVFASLYVMGFHHDGCACNYCSILILKMFKNAENEREIISKFYFRNENKLNQWFCILDTRKSHI